MINVSLDKSCAPPLDINLESVQNDNNILDDIKSKLENVINDIISKKDENNIIIQLSDIILQIDNKRNISINNNNIVEKKTENYDNGKYEGEFINGKKNGKGIFYFNNGNIYDGEWKDGKEDGKGTFLFGRMEQNI